MKSKLLASFSCLLASASAAPAYAAYTVTIEESGSDLVMSGSGSLNVAKLPFILSATARPTLNPRGGEVIIGDGTFSPNAVDWYGTSFYNTLAFGTAFAISPRVSSGPLVGLNSMLGILIVPKNYVSGSQLGTSWNVIDNASFASLGLVRGSYVATLNHGADTFTINVGAPVPEPSTWAMLLIGFGLTGASLRIRTRKTSRLYGCAA